MPLTTTPYSEFASIHNTEHNPIFPPFACTVSYSHQLNLGASQ
jgi:hypothetical protein